MHTTIHFNSNIANDIIDHMTIENIMAIKNYEDEIDSLYDYKKV